VRKELVVTESRAAGVAADRGHGDHHKVIHYTVNAEPQETTEHKLTVRVILEDAGFKPAENYELTRDQDGKTFTDLDKELPIREGEAFTATFTGPTPTS
jgi:hypothetical protein